MKWIIARWLRRKDYLNSLPQIPMNGLTVYQMGDLYRESRWHQCLKINA